VTWLATAWGKARGWFLAALAIVAAFLGVGAWWYRRRALRAEERADREAHRAESNRRLVTIFGRRADGLASALDAQGEILRTRDDELEKARAEAERAYREADEYRAEFAKLGASTAWDQAFGRFPPDGAEDADEAGAGGSDDET